MFEMLSNLSVFSFWSWTELIRTMQPMDRIVLYLSGFDGFLKCSNDVHTWYWIFTAKQIITWDCCWNITKHWRLPRCPSFRTETGASCFIQVCIASGTNVFGTWPLPIGVHIEDIESCPVLCMCWRKYVSVEMNCIHFFKPNIPASFFE